MIKLKSLLFEQTTKNLNVLFVGDSQTVSGISYASQLINSGVVSGNIVAKVGASMSSIYKMFSSNYKPNTYDVVSILGGNNDASTAKFDRSSLTRIIAESLAGGSKVAVVTCPTMAFINKRLYPGKYPSMHTIPIWEASLRSDGVVIIDAYKLLNDKRYFASDGLHLNKTAHSAIVQAWIDRVNTLDIATLTPKVTSGKREVKFGDTGQNVKNVQDRLIKLNYSIGPEQNDGIFGPHTQNGVSTFQKVNKLPVTGNVDEKTLSTLESPSAIECPENLRTNDVAGVIGTELNSSQTASAKTIIDFFKSKGLSQEQGVGIAANLQAESGFKTGAIGDSGTSMGLAQWHDERMNNLISWTKQNNIEPDSVNGQLEFLWYELNNSEKNALAKIKSTTTAEQAAAAFCTYFERPANALARSAERANIASNLSNNLGINNIA